MAVHPADGGPEFQLASRTRETLDAGQRPVFTIRLTEGGCHARVVDLPAIELVAANEDELIEAARHAVAWALDIDPLDFEITIDGPTPS